MSLTRDQIITIQVFGQSMVESATELRALTRRGITCRHEETIPDIVAEIRVNFEEIAKSLGYGVHMLEAAKAMAELKPVEV